MLSHEHYMRLALEEAEQAYAEEEVPIGAVAVSEGQVIAQAHNQREVEQNPLAHAEIAILAQASQQLRTWRLEHVTVYVTLEPCLMCMGALLQARIKHLVFGALDPKAGACGSLYDLSQDERLNHTFEVTSDVLATEAADLLKKFFQERRGK